MKLLLTIALSGFFISSCHCPKTSRQSTVAPETGAAARPLEGTYWVLTELNGNAVNPPKDGEKPSYIYFNASGKRVSVSGGCNVMSGSYDLLEGNRLTFGQMMSTMMACPDMTNEDGLKKMTGMVDNYAIEGDNLYFAKARMAPAARFKAATPPAGFKIN